MKQTKQFLHPLLMAIVMLVGMLVPKGARAQSPVTVGDQGFSTIQEAINYIVDDMVDDATLTLHQDFTLEDYDGIDISFFTDDDDFNFTIDLNGHTITGGGEWDNNSIGFSNNGSGLPTVTIDNSCQYKKGKLFNCRLDLNQHTKVIVNEGVSLYPRFDLLNLAPQVCDIHSQTSSLINYGDLYGDVMVGPGGSFINNGRVAYVNGEFENNGDYCAYFNWADDGSSVSAYVNGCTYGYNEWDEEISITSEVTKEPTCTEPGVRTFTGTFIGYFYSGEQEFTDTKEVEISIDPDAHDYQVQNVVWSEDYTTATLQLVCSRDEEHTANVEVTGEGITSEDTTPATCTPGVRTYTAKATYNDVEYTGTATVTIDPTVEHNLDEHNVCTECGHGFIFFETNDPDDIEPEDPEAFSNSEGPVDYLGNTTINGENAFEFSGLVTEIGNRAFYNRQALTAIYLPEVTTIGEEAFWSCKFDEISLPKATTIGYAAFGFCGNLSSIDLPKATTIGDDAFYECYNLSSITVACAADLSGAEIPEEATITRVHDFTNKTLTDEPVEDGLYAYACDRGCGAHSDDHIVKGDGDGNTIALTATTDGETTTYTAADVTIEDGKAFSTPVAFTTSNVTMAREFTQSVGDAVVPATIMLPFSIEANKLATVNGDVVTGTKFYGFTSLTKNAETGKWEANMDRVTGTILAHTPYMIVLTEGTAIDFSSNEVTFPKTPESNNDTQQEDWTFVATNEAKVWTDADFANGEVYYGFAAGNETTPEGKFVKVGAGASIDPLRAYIMKTPAAGPANAPTRAMTASQVPSTISVRLNETSVTGIGTLNIETGEFTFDGWYDLQGRRISEPVKNGISINNGKKIMVK